MTERWRCFVGIPLSAAFRAEMAALAAGWHAASAGSDLRWTDPAAWHLTLAFLGDVPADQVPELVARLPDLVRGPSPTLAAEEVVAWPDTAGARMLWCRLHGDARLSELHQRVADGLDVTERRRFRPHLTLARVPGGRSIVLGAWAHDLAPPSTTSPVDEVVLYRSHLGAGGSRYEPLATVPVSGAAA
jgi:2'-5' RNA ligase